MPVSFKGRTVTPGRVVDAVTSRVKAYFIHPVVGTAPRMIWGNDAGIRGNVIGRIQIARGQRAYRRTHGSGPTPNASAAHLTEQGYAPIRPTYPKGLLEGVVAAYRAAMASDRDSRWIGVGRYLETARGIVDTARTLPDLEGFLTPNVRAAVEAYYGSHFEVMHVRAWRTRHVPGLETSADAYSNQWHADRDPISMLRLFVYLSDGVTRETGAFRMHTLASTRAIVRSGGYFHRTMILPRANAMLEDPARIVYFEGDAGDGCLANVELCLHRAGIPRAGYDRDIVQFTLRPSAKPLTDGWLRRLPTDH
jgi:hypothetical protein